MGLDPIKAELGLLSRAEATARLVPHRITHGLWFLASRDAEKLFDSAFSPERMTSLHFLCYH